MSQNPDCPCPAVALFADTAAAARAMGVLAMTPGRGSDGALVTLPHGAGLAIRLYAAGAVLVLEAAVSPSGWPDQSALAPDRRTISPHLAISALTKAV